MDQPPRSASRKGNDGQRNDGETRGHGDVPGRSGRGFQLARFRFFLEFIQGYGDVAHVLETPIRVFAQAAGHDLSASLVSRSFPPNSGFTAPSSMFPSGRLRRVFLSIWAFRSLLDSSLARC